MFQCRLCYIGGGFQLFKKCITLIVLSLILVGCTTDSKQSNTVSNDIINIPSSINIEVNNKSMSIPLTSYVTIKHLENGTVSETTHDHATKKLSKEYATFTLSPNEVVLVDKTIKNHPKISVNYFDKQSNKQIELTLSNNSFKIPSNKGQYEYRIDATWHNCRATYTFLSIVK